MVRLVVTCQPSLAAEKPLALPNNGEGAKHYLLSEANYLGKKN